MQASEAAEAERSSPAGQKLTAHPHGHAILGVAVSPDGQWFATCGWHGHAAVWHAATGMRALTLEGFHDVDSSVMHVAWSPKGTHLAAAVDNESMVWELAKPELLPVAQTLEGHADNVLSVTWSPSGAALCTGARDATARIWMLATGREVLELDHDDADVHTVAWSPNGTYVATGGDEGSVSVWETVEGTAEYVLEGHMHTVDSVAWSPDGSMLVSCSRDHTARVWDVATGNAKHTLQGHNGGVSSVVWSPDGRFLATASGGRTVMLWDVATGTATRVIEVSDSGVAESGMHGVVVSVAWGGGHVFAATDKGEVFIFSATEGQ